MNDHACLNKFFRIVWSAARGAWVAVAETARGHGRGGMRRRRALAGSLIGVLAGVAGAAAPPAATQLPTGGQLVAGQASLKQSGATLTITQASQRAAIDWQTFDLGSQARIDFVQPGASSVTLNRVLDTNPSQIFGRIDAPGQVFIVNPNGVLFGASAQVDVGGLVATTLSIGNADFMAGKTTFGADAATAGGAVVDNEGHLVAGLGGYVALLAPQVRNGGVIVAREGTVALAAGDQVTLQFGGNRPLAVQVDRAALNALVDNRNAIRADGGLVLLSASSANALLDTVISNSGAISADTLAEHGGRIVLEGGTSGVVSVGGTVQARGLGSGQAGGTIVATGDKVLVPSGALLDARGTAGGGTIDVGGGGWHGSDATIPQATATIVEAGATLDASATVNGNGNGGTVEVWSDITNATGATRAWGTFLANAGAQGGDGGRIETSGHWLDTTGARGGAQSAKGVAGTWLFDPYNVTISASASSGVADTVGGGNSTWTPLASGSNIQNTDIQAHLEGGTNVTITTGATGPELGDITVNAPITKTTGATDVTLTLKAANTIDIEAPIANTGGAGKLHVALDADDDLGVHDGNGAIILNADITTGGGNLTFGTGATMNIGGVVTQVGGDVYVGGSGARTLSTAGGNVTINGEMLIANPSGLDVETANGNVLFGGLLNSGDTYSLVNTPLQWNQAMLAAQSGTGANPGDTYLTTITSRLENAIASRAANYVDSWLGAHRGATDGTTTTVDANWRWVTGPEGLANGGTGTIFFVQTGSGSGTTTPGYFVNWNPGEPNNSGGGANYAINGESAIQFTGNSGLWNDLPDGIANSASPLPYSVETNLAPSPLTVHAGTGTVTFAGAVGTLKALASVDITAASVVLAGGAVTTSGTQTWNAPITAPAGMALSGDQIVLNGTTMATAGDIAITAAAGNIQVNDAMSAAGGNIALTASGGVTGSGGIALAGSAPTLTVTQAGNTTFDGVIDGANATLVKDGAGILGLTATNTYAGGTTLAGGELELDSLGAIGSTGTIGFTGGTLRFSGSNGTDYSARISNAPGQLYSFDTNGREVFMGGDLTSVGGSLTKWGNDNLELDGTNAYDGGTVVNGGYLKSGGGSMTRTAFGTGPITVNAGGTLETDRSILANDLVLNGGALWGTNGFGEQWSGTVSVTADSLIWADFGITFAGTITGSGKLTLQHNGTFTIAGDDTRTGITQVDAGTLQIGNNGTTGSVSGDIVDNGNVVFARSDALTYSGAISGGGTLAQSGSGTLTLTANSTYTGATTIDNGTLVIQNDAPILTTPSFAGPGALTIQPASASFAGAYTFNATTSGLGGLQVGKPGNAADIDFAVATDVAGPVAIYGGNVTLGANLSLTAGGAPLLVQANGDIVQASGVAVSTAGGSVVYQSNADDNAAGGFIWLQGLGQNTSITTSGGDITLTGGSNVTNGGSQGRSSGNGTGITLDDATLSSGGGDISMHGNGFAGPATTINSTDGATNNTDGVRMLGNDDIDAGSGTIMVIGTTNGLGASNGVELSTIGSTTLHSSNPSIGIEMVGESQNIAAGNSFGLYTWHSTIVEDGGGTVALGGIGRDGGLVVSTGTSVLANSGLIELLAITLLPSPGITIAGTVGQQASSAVPTSSSDILLETDSLAITGTLQSSGGLTISPYAASTTVGLGSNSGTLQIPASLFGGSIVNGFSHITVGNSGGTGLVTVGALALGTPLTVQNGTGDIALTGALDIGAETLTLNDGGNVSQANAAAITTANLLLTGGGNFTLGAAGNSVGTLAATAGSLAFHNNGALTIGTVDTTIGVAATDTVAIATGTGDLQVTQAVATTDASAHALSLAAGANAGAGTTAGGDVVLTGAASLSTGAGGTAALYTGSIAGSTGVADAVGSGSGNFRYDSTATTSNFTTALGSGVYAVYREQPTITVTASDAGKTYDGAAFSGGNGVAIAGWINGDTSAALTGTVAYGGSAQGQVNAGTAAISASGLGSGLGYAIAYADGTLTVAPKVVSLSATKVYDGTTNLAGDVTVSTGVGGETLTYTGASASDAHVATASKTITSITLADGSGLASNYVLPTLDAADAPVTITPAVLTPTLTNTGITKTYDGTTSAAGLAPTFGFGGFASGDTGASLTHAGAAYDSSHVAGASLVTVSGLALAAITGSSGSATSDYTLGATSADAAATITPKALTSAATIGGTLTKVYDGTNVATGATVGGGVSGAIGGDALLLDTSGVSLAYNGTHVVGTTAIVASGAGALTIASSTDGSVASDYSFTAPAIANAVASITPKALTSTATIGGTLTKVYDGTNVATGATVGASVSGAIGGDALSLDASGIALAYNGSHVVGTNAIVASGAGTLAIASSTDGSVASDYGFTAPAIANASASITARTITVVAPAAAKVEDGNVAASGTVTVGGAGLVSGDAVADVTLQFDTAVVGTGKTVTPSALVLGGAGLASDYAVSYVDNHGGVIAPALPIAPLVIAPRLPVAPVPSSAARIVGGPGSVLPDSAGHVVELVAIASPTGNAPGFSFRLPGDQVGAAMSASLPGGAGLPAWLHFDPATGVFSAQAIPQDGLPLDIDVNTDGKLRRVRLARPAGAIS